MKTTNTTNDLRYTTTRTKKGIDYVIKIRLNDECKNGHNDFSITGDMYTADKPHTDRNNQGGGAIGDTIAKHFPELSIFNDLHLCDAKGAPMYAQANGFYHLKNTGKEVTMNYLRITEIEYNILDQADEQDYFTYLLDNVLNVPVRWLKEAEMAIKLLEDMTEKSFKDDSVRYQFTPLLADAVKDIESKIAAGYYKTASIEERRLQKIADKKQALIDSLTEDRDKSIKKANDEYNIKMYVLNSGLPISNFIYYNHTNEGVFNWKDCDAKITVEQLTHLQEQGTPESLPVGIIFKIGK